MGMSVKPVTEIIVHSLSRTVLLCLCVFVCFLCAGFYLVFQFRSVCLSVSLSLLAVGREVLLIWFSDISVTLRGLTLGTVSLTVACAVSNPGITVSLTAVCGMGYV